MRTSDDEAGHAVDLTNCDREPIHIPGRIQPHGVLLVLDEKTLEIRHATDNAKEVLGADHRALLGSRLDAWIAADRREETAATLRADDLKQAKPIEVAVEGPGGGRCAGGAAPPSATRSARMAPASPPGDRSSPGRRPGACGRSRGPIAPSRPPTR